MSTATSGQEAGRLASLDRPDVVLLDVMMPALDGPGTAAGLAAQIVHEAWHGESYSTGQPWEGPAAERHALHRARGQRRERAAHVILMAERALDDVRETFDVVVRVHRPDGARHEPVVVEDPHRSERRVLRVDVGVERVMPAGPEPSAVHVGDLVIPSDLQHHRIVPRRVTEPSW